MVLSKRVNKQEITNFVKKNAPTYYMGDYIDAERSFWEYEYIIKNFVDTYKNINVNDIPKSEINKFVDAYPKFIFGYKNLVALKNTPVTMVYEEYKQQPFLYNISVVEYKKRNWAKGQTLEQFDKDTLNLIEDGKKIYEEIISKSGKTVERRRKSITRRRETGQGTNATMNRIFQNIKAVTKQNIGKFGKL